MIMDDKTALVSPAEFDALAEYSMSVPTSPSIGRIWKRRAFRVVPRQNPTGPDQKEIQYLDQAWLGEAVPDSEPGYVGIKWRDLLVVR